MGLFMLPDLTLPELKTSATNFSHELHSKSIPDLYGTTDGKAVGTYIEQLFRQYLGQRYTFQPGNSANGIDLPGLEVDLKATSYKQPQSSCPFRNASQKIYGLGYHLLIFVYDKRDDPKIGYLTISNALQWRLQYSRAINAAVQGNVRQGVPVLWRGAQGRHHARLSPGHLRI